MKSVACLRLMSSLTRVELCHRLLDVCYKDDYQFAANQNSLVVKEACASCQAALKGDEADRARPPRLCAKSLQSS